MTATDEHLDELALSRERLVDLLDYQELLEASGPEDLGEIDLRDATRGNLLGQEVLAKGRGHSAHPPPSVPCSHVAVPGPSSSPCRGVERRVYRFGGADDLDRAGGPQCGSQLRRAG